MNNTNQNNPEAFVRTAKKAVGTMREAMKKSQEKVKDWNDTMYKDRWKNLAWSVLFSIILCIAFYVAVVFGLFILGLIAGWIIIVFTGSLALLCLYTMVSYIKIIFKG